MKRIRVLIFIVLLIEVAAFIIAVSSDDSHAVTRRAVGGPPVTQTQAAVQPTSSCPPGASAMGCVGRKNVPAQPQTFGLAPVAGPEFPDVSLWQGHPNWPAVAAWQRSHGWPTGGVFKMGEYHLDPDADFNAAATAHLDWRAGYWFVRNTGCSHELALIVWAAKRYGLRIVVLDIEVPEARGYTTCLIPGLRKAGLVVVVYTGPGTWAGGQTFGAPLWDATYGSHPQFAGLWTSAPAAWQFTDGHFGNATFVPGVGFDDVSVDFGISKLGAPPADPYAIFPTRPNERGAVRGWDRAHCRNPARRAVCRRDHAALVRYRGRVAFLAHHRRAHGHWRTLTHARWGENHLGVRYQEIARRLR